MQILKDRLDELLEKAVEGAAVAGYVAGVHHQGQQIELARGIANLNTGAPMTVDTRFQIGSVTKVLTTHLLLRYVEAGKISLDDRVVAHLPEFRLCESGAAERLSVRQLLNHTNGIDADSFSPMAEYGPAATRDYVARLSGFGTLFAAGDAIHYSNAGFVVAARLIEVLSGKHFNKALEEELFHPCGMLQSCTSVEQAVLHHHAVGAFAHAASGRLQASHSFMLPASLAGAGSTPISTVKDLLAYGRAHLAGGRSIEGQRVLSSELIAAMQTVTFDMKTPNVPPIGLGWWKVPVSGVTVFWHGGTTLGTTSSFAVCPELDLVVVSAGTGPGANALHDRVLLTVLAHLGHEAVSPFVRAPLSDLPSRYAGTYRHFPLCLQIDAQDDRLSARAFWAHMDEEFHRTMVWPSTGEAFDKADTRFAFDGGSTFVLDLVPVADGLFAPAGANDAQLCGISGRLGLISFSGNGSRPDAVQTRLRYMRGSA
ncbi:serine hydrolase domain-containing protein [Burkholderia sp. Ac-20353]|uniref:serine hydrolase domain-containing protein n=1 Tax=Burkholderia sp. Ac-20353 TaxID=2703894 RepID=UPI00197CA339|nr:serine hydrolase domain-containing protein [Burkholderia sp. Ac-20353]MBN3788552.1 beta-lactamase family protein [Burkholderia sp. Ac-20353]